MNENEKKSYIKALMYIALADDTVEEDERIFIQQIGQIYNLPNADLVELENSILQRAESLEDILSGITERKHKLLLLFDLMALCFADNHYSETERKGMDNICSIMEIEKSKLDEIENILREHLALQVRVNQILER